MNLNLPLESQKILSDEGTFATTFLAEDQFGQPIVIKKYRKGIVNSYDHRSMIKQGHRIRNEPKVLNDDILIEPLDMEFTETDMRASYRYKEGWKLTPISTAKQLRSAACLC